MNHASFICRTSCIVIFRLNMKRLFLVSLLFTFFFNSCSVVKFARYYAAADSSKGVLKGRIYQTDRTSYEIGELADGWKRINIKGGDLAFWNEKLGSTITVNSTCNKDNKEVKYSLKALSDSLILGISDKELIHREEIVVGGENALESVYRGKLDKTSVKIGTVVLKKGSCFYDLSYASSPDSFEAGIFEFREFVLQFKVI